MNTQPQRVIPVEKDQAEKQVEADGVVGGGGGDCCSMEGPQRPP